MTAPSQDQAPQLLQVAVRVTPGPPRAPADPTSTVATIFWKSAVEASPTGRVSLVPRAEQKRRPAAGPTWQDAVHRRPQAGAMIDRVHRELTDEEIQRLL